ncbi:hypothetical protein LPTSP4_04190 [Leptospira ryugenii]|uniref:TIGR02757 family protein n=1 Tax=Leptospira ryugenii TaxID=1917863 RepID=A0A2P2DWA0_9LEPT|nr:TIGR02757 family protein [Leptospira ryugenii]GBF48915.1 hypothetical protein LPTSP4_04190 [Leptospira ryugenii]
MKKIQQFEYKLSPLHAALEGIKAEFSNDDLISTDPILFPKRYQNPLDIEIVALLSALYAYGNVIAIQRFLEPIFQALGENPYYAFATRSERFEQAIKVVQKYRFQTKEDNENILYALSEILRVHRETDDNNAIFEEFFLFKGSNFEPVSSIARFQKKLLSQLESKKPITGGIRFWIGDPESHSAKKRICLFLRWMVRRNHPDFGIYKRISQAEIPFPLDTHIQRLVQILGLSTRKTYGMREAILVRDQFLRLSPEDPLQYDFYLTRVGIIQRCKAKRIESICGGCGLRSVCNIW